MSWEEKDTKRGDEVSYDTIVSAALHVLDMAEKGEINGFLFVSVRAVETDKGISCTSTVHSGAVNMPLEPLREVIAAVMGNLDAEIVKRHAAIVKQEEEDILMRALDAPAGVNAGSNPAGFHRRPLKEIIAELDRAAEAEARHLQEIEASGDTKE